MTFLARHRHRRKIIPSPVLCAAGGAAFAYYCLSTLYSRGFIGFYTLLTLIFIPVSVMCLLWVLTSWPVSKNSPSVRRRRVVLLRLAAFTAGLAIGIGAGSKAIQKVSFGIPQAEVRAISGILLDDPRLISGGRAMTTLSLKMTLGESGVRASARGEVTVFFPEENAGRLKEFGRGSEVFAEGVLARGRGFGDSYLFIAENLHITEIAPPLEHFRTGLRLGLAQRFTASWGGLALALLVGIRDNLDTGFTSLFRDAGCSYILALSGMHLAVIVALVSFLLRKPLGLKASAILGAVIIIAYCFIVGPLPSLSRAALMYLLGVFAVLGMLKKDALSVLGMAFLLQLTVASQTGFSVSFMLSYVALMGILVIGRSLNDIFKGTIPAILLSPLSVSLGAFIATAGITVWFFGILRPVGILASLVLTPLITVFMLGSIAWLALDTVLPSISFLLDQPLSLLYWLMEKIAVLAGYMPGISAQPWLVITLSLLLAALAVCFDRRRRIAANHMEPFA